MCAAKLLKLLRVVIVTVAISAAAITLSYVFVRVLNSETANTIHFEVVSLVTITAFMALSMLLPIRRPAKKITAKILAKWLHTSALASLMVVVVVIVAPSVAPVSISGLIHMIESEDAPDATGSELPAAGITDGDLFMAAATIMGLAVFGSALGTLGRGKDSVKGVAYTLVPTITVQAAFMLDIMDILHFPAVVWIPMTAILLMLVVLAMVANKLLPDRKR